MSKIKTTEDKRSAGDSVSRHLSLAGLAMVAAVAISLALTTSPVQAAEDSGGASADVGGPSADVGGPSADVGGPSADGGAGTAADDNGGGSNGTSGPGIPLPTQGTAPQ